LKHSFQLDPGVDQSSLVVEVPRGSTSPFARLVSRSHGCVACWYHMDGIYTFHMVPSSGMSRCLTAYLNNIYQNAIIYRVGR